MKNPTTNGSRASCNLFADKMQSPISTAAIQAQMIAARFGITPELAATVAALAFGGAQHG